MVCVCVYMCVCACVCVCVCKMADHCSGILFAGQFQQLKWVMTETQISHISRINTSGQLTWAGGGSWEYTPPPRPLPPVYLSLRQTTSHSPHLLRAARKSLQVEGGRSMAWRLHLKTSWAHRTWPRGWGMEVVKEREQGRDLDMQRGMRGKKTSLMWPPWERTSNRPGLPDTAKVAFYRLEQKVVGGLVMPG